MKATDYADLCIESYKKGPSAGWYDVQDLRVGFIYFGDQLNIVCRGSANFRNWLRDFFVVPKRSFDGYLEHGGVVDAFNLLAPLINDKLKRHPINAKKVVVGHSLGGGLARPISRYLGCKAITFGPLCTDYRYGPMPVNNEFMIVDEEDPVWRVPHFLYMQNAIPIATLKRDDEFPIDARHHFITHYREKLAKLPEIIL